MIEEQYKDTMELIDKLYSELPLVLKRKMMTKLVLKYSLTIEVKVIKDE